MAAVKDKIGQLVGQPFACLVEMTWLRNVSETIEHFVEMKPFLSWAFHLPTLSCSTHTYFLHCLITLKIWQINRRWFPVVRTELLDMLDDGEILSLLLENHCCLPDTVADLRRLSRAFQRVPPSRLGSELIHYWTLILAEEITWTHLERELDAKFSNFVVRARHSRFMS